LNLSRLIKLNIWDFQIYQFGSFLHRIYNLHRIKILIRKNKKLNPSLNSQFSFSKLKIRKYKIWKILQNMPVPQNNPKISVWLKTFAGEVDPIIHSFYWECRNEWVVHKSKWFFKFTDTIWWTINGTNETNETFCNKENVPLNIAMMCQKAVTKYFLITLFMDSLKNVDVILL
jgi:hypothetical protein